MAATTTHYSSAEAHGVTDPGQDLGTSGGPMQLVNLVLSQMSQLGAAAVEHGVDAAVILDGRIPHGMLLEIFTRRGAGTPRMHAK